MFFTVLGSGSSEPHPKRASSGYWLYTSAGSIMLDMSAPAVHRAAQENLDWANLDALWISHFHLDHIGGIAPFLFGTKYAFATQQRTKPLRIFSAKGLRKIIENFDAANDYNLFEQPFPLEFIEVKPEEDFEILPNIRAKTCKTLHVQESMAIKISSVSSSLVYTADTGFEPKLGEFARNVDLFVLEGSFVEKSPVESHLTAPQCVELMKLAEPKSAMLTHFYGEWDAVDFQIELAKYSPPCEVLEATDGLCVKI